MIFEGFSLAARVQWLIRLRWIAVVAVVTTIAVSASLNLIVGAVPLLVVAGLLAAANAGFALMARSGNALSASAGTQVVTDLLALTFLLHYAGGSANPFAFFYVFHVIISSVLFSARAAYLIAVVSTVLYGGLTAADILGYCPRHPLVGAPSHFSTRYAMGRLAAFAATVTASAYFGTTIVGALRRKQEELRESRERLGQAEKLAAIGQLAAGIAHELNTPLGSILVAAEVTRETAAPGSEGAQLLGDIVRETKRCKEITRSLLDFSRKRDLSLDFTDAGEVVRQAVGLVKREAGVRAGCVEVDAPGGLPRVRTDAGALGQVVVNVVKNALDAVEGREGARVRVEAFPAAGGVGIRIVDNGAGIPPADMPKIFEPFFTTKDPGRGTGLGLALSYAIMRDLRGEIEVRSDEGTGTQVTLSLPADAGRVGA